MNTKLHAVTDAEGRPIRFYMTAGQVSDYTAARALLSQVSRAGALLADRGYDASCFRNALVEVSAMRPCCPSCWRRFRMTGPSARSGQMAPTTPGPVMKPWRCCMTCT
jgi:transposase